MAKSIFLNTSRNSELSSGLSSPGKLSFNPQPSRVGPNPASPPGELLFSVNIIKKGQNPCEVTELNPIFLSLAAPLRASAAAQGDDGEVGPRGLPGEPVSIPPFGFSWGRGLGWKRCF